MRLGLRYLLKKGIAEKACEYFPNPSNCSHIAIDSIPNFTQALFFNIGLNIMIDNIAPQLNQNTRRGIALVGTIGASIISEYIQYKQHG